MNKFWEYRKEHLSCKLIMKIISKIKATRRPIVFRMKISIWGRESIYPQEPVKHNLLSKASKYTSLKPLLNTSK